MDTVITIKLIKPKGGPVTFRVHLIKQALGSPILVQYKDTDERITLPTFEAEATFTDDYNAFLDAFGEKVVKLAEEMIKSLQQPGQEQPKA